MSHGGVTFGTVTGGTNGSDLVVTFNASASQTAVAGLLHALTYANSNTNGASTLDRTIRITVSDGDGGTSNNNDVTVHVGLRQHGTDAGREQWPDPSRRRPAPITTAQLDFNDVEQADTAIVYTITTAANNGTLYRNGVALALNGTFTQVDINNGLITLHPGTAAGTTTSELRFLGERWGERQCRTGRTFDFAAGGERCADAELP